MKAVHMKAGKGRDTGQDRAKTETKGWARARTRFKKGVVCCVCTGTES